MNNKTNAITATEARAGARPSHRIFAVTKASGNGKKFWRPIGAMWVHAKGDGFNLRLDYLPLNGAEIVARAILEDDAEPSEA